MENLEMRDRETRAPVVTRSIRSTEPEPWTFDPEVKRIDREARARDGLVVPALWEAAPAVLWLLACVGALGVVATCIVLITGCSSPLAVSAQAGTVAHGELTERYEAEQRACLDLSTAAFATACVDGVRARYAPAWAAYRAFYLAWLTAHAAEYGEASDAVAAAEEATAAALGGIHAR